LSSSLFCSMSSWTVVSSFIFQALSSMASSNVLVSALLTHSVEVVIETWRCWTLPCNCGWPSGKKNLEAFLSVYVNFQYNIGDRVRVERREICIAAL
jgi:hypothetical protein